MRGPGKNNKKCSVIGCTKKHKGHSFCKMHLMRFYSTGNPLKTKIRLRGEGTFDKKGYKILFKDGKLIPEHRWIMEQHLGRKLKWPSEVVHHIDHNVLNNHISNLQLMSNSEHSKHHHPLLSRETTIKKLCLKCNKIKLKKFFSCWKNRIKPYCKHCCMLYARQIKLSKRAIAVIWTDLAIR